MGCTSLVVAFATFIPLPFILVTTAYRFWIRHNRKLWGGDDWAMLALLMLIKSRKPVWTVNVVGLVGMAWSGVGVDDATLSYQQQSEAYFWFYVFQECWCFTLVAIKWSLGFTLTRIAGPILWVEVTIYICLALVTICTGGTGMYLFFQCSPVQKNWYFNMPGVCNAREIQTALSYLVAAVSILTDWTFALLPIFLLWNVQMKTRIKVSVIALLSLGIFASVAPIVRLKYLLGMNDLDHFLQNLGDILAWAAAEANVGMLLANLPACRPLLESLYTGLFSSRDDLESSAVTGSGGNEPDRQDWELGMRRAKTKDSEEIGVETRMYGAEMDGDSDDYHSMGDGDSQKHMVGESLNMGGQTLLKDIGGKATTADSTV